MKKLLTGLLFMSWAACQAPAPKDDKGTQAAGSVDLPCQATYTADWVEDVSKYVSDQDLKMVLQTYKYWEQGNVDAMMAVHDDSVVLSPSSGSTRVVSRAELKKLWQTTRDSLSQVTISMQSWHKMYSPAKKDAYIVTWFKEYDVYKDGKIDSAEYHDLNLIKNSKIAWYSTYRRPL